MVNCGGNGPILSLSPIKLSHAGKYTCQVTITPSSLQGDITVKCTNHWDVRVKSELNTILAMALQLLVPSTI